MAHSTEVHTEGNGHAAARDATARSLRESATQVFRRTKSAAIRSDAMVRAHPWKAVGVVALLGAAAGYLASRRPAKSSH
jgi:ElaB/YqjD/DUF883 family membrane-anchored ribosome-binding protein